MDFFLVVSSLGQAHLPGSLQANTWVPPVVQVGCVAPYGPGNPVQGYRAHKKLQPPRTLKYTYLGPYSGPRGMEVSCLGTRGNQRHLDIFLVCFGTCLDRPNMSWLDSKQVLARQTKHVVAISQDSSCQDMFWGGGQVLVGQSLR